MLSTSAWGWAWTSASTARRGAVTRSDASRSCCSTSAMPPPHHSKWNESRKAEDRCGTNGWKPVRAAWEPAGMPLAPYRRVLSVPAARSALLLGLLLRVPMFAGGVVLTLHIVQSLHRSYTEAGVVTALATVCIAISGPWRGRLLDRMGLRRTVVPSIIVTALVWSVAPFVGYLPLL